MRIIKSIRALGIAAFGFAVLVLPVVAAQQPMKIENVRVTLGSLLVDHRLGGNQRRHDHQVDSERRDGDAVGLRHGRVSGGPGGHLGYKLLPQPGGAAAVGQRVRVAGGLVGVLLFLLLGLIAEKAHRRL